jgi:hypothetical protein
MCAPFQHCHAQIWRAGREQIIFRRIERQELIAKEDAVDWI